MSETLKVSEDGRFRVRLMDDMDCENPRKAIPQADQVVHVVTVPNPGYFEVSGSQGPLAWGWDRIKHENPDAAKIFERWARIFHGAVTLYEFPSMAAARVWYMVPAQFGEVPDPAAALKEEAREYRAWADGETYGYVIERAVKWDRRDGAGEMITWGEAGDDGSLWGLIGYKYAHETALTAFAEYLKTGV